MYARLKTKNIEFVGPLGVLRGPNDFRGQIRMLQGSGWHRSRIDGIGLNGLSHPVYFVFEGARKVR